MSEPPRRSFTLRERPGWRLLTVCSLYFTQGLPYGFMFITLAAVLASADWTAGDIAGLLIWAGLPWSFKWIAGPVIDWTGIQSMGRRRPWILLAQSGLILSLMLLASGPDPLMHRTWLSAGLFCISACSALQDVSVDALAVDLLREEERGRVSGFMYGCSNMGQALGGAAMGALVAVTDLRVGFFAVGVVVAVVMLLPLLLRERPGERLFPWTSGRASSDAPEPAESMLMVVRRLGRAFSLRSAMMLAVVAVLVSIPSGFLISISKVLLISDLGWTVTEETFWSGTATWAGLAGSIGGGLFADVVGARRLAVIAGCCVAAGSLVFAVAQSWWTVDAFIIGHMFWDALFSGAMYVSIFALAMKVSWPLVAATQFTAYMAMLNLSRILGQGLTTQLDEVVTADQAYMIAAVLQVLPLVLMLMIDPGQTRRVLGEGHEDASTPEGG